ncbi:MAG: tetratricopeptide repeat protein [Alphaproteobacteria bacterium]|nr:tetratricopeptide repeat protein [Alphaproteobacteria bacterium]
MNVRKYILSCAAIALSGGSLCLLGATAHAQPTDDFFTPPVVENVTEIEMPEIDAPDALAMPNDSFVDIDAPVNDLGDDPFINASPDELGAFVPEDTMDDTDEAQIDAETLPDFPVVETVEDDISAENNTPVDIAIEAPAPIANVVEDAPAEEEISDNAIPTPAIPVPAIQPNKPSLAPGGEEALKAISGESKGGVQASSGFEDIEEKYYSADRGVTTSDLNAPVKADPDKDPAQRIVIIDRVGTKNSVDARFVAAQRALDLRRYDAALQMFDDLYAKNRRDQRVLMGRAVALQMTGHEEKAIQAYEELLELTPKNPKVLVNLMGLISKQYPAVALERLKGLYEKNPGNAAIVAQMGLAEAKLHNYASAERYIGIASSIEPNNALHYYNLAVVYDRNKNYDDAIKHYEHALQIDALNRGGRIKREVIYDRLSRLRNM